jgi:hypothetical protein
MIRDPPDVWIESMKSEFKGSLEKMERAPTLQELRDILTWCVETALDLAR